MKQNLFIFLLYILIFWQQYAIGQRTAEMRENFQKQLNEKNNLFSIRDLGENFVTNYAGDQEADMTVVSFI